MGKDSGLDTAGGAWSEKERTLEEIVNSEKAKKNEQDPYGKDAKEAGAKLGQGKPDLRLLLDFAPALIEVTKVLMHGVEKYSEGGWVETPDGFNRYTSAMIRHLLKEKEGMIDKDSGLLHASQVAWNALARLTFLLRK